MTPTMKSGLGLAAAAAMLAMSGASTAAYAKAPAGKAEVVHCYGVNTCKGTSDCKSYGHECKGQNECKGQGFKAESKKSCLAQGGKLTEQ